MYIDDTHRLKFISRKVGSKIDDDAILQIIRLFFVWLFLYRSRCVYYELRSESFHISIETCT